MANREDGDVREMKHAEGFTEDGDRIAFLSYARDGKAVVTIVLEEGYPIEAALDAENATNLRDQLDTILRDLDNVVPIDQNGRLSPRSQGPHSPTD